MLAAYVSSHGFGHSTRVAEVLRAVRRRAPDLPITVVTSAPQALYRGVSGPPAHRQLECDVGVAQHGALVLDEAATLARWREFEREQPGRVAAEAEWLRTSGARVVLGDIPPLAFEAATEAGIPAVGLANFSWDWIYRHLARRHPPLEEAAAAAARAYARATLVLRLPFAGDLSAFPRVEDVPLVARRPSVGKREARARLGLPTGTVVLLSFGGFGLPGFDPVVLAPHADFFFVTTPTDRPLPANVRAIGGRELEAHGLGYEDLVGAADVVVTKPGYGIVSDAIGAQARLVYTDRGDFPEYPILVREMARMLPSTYVSNEDLMRGMLREPIRRVLSSPVTAAPDTRGAEVAAEVLLEAAA